MKSLSKVIRNGGTAIGFYAVNEKTGKRRDNKAPVCQQRNIQHRFRSFLFPPVEAYQTYKTYRKQRREKNAVP